MGHTRKRYSKDFKAKVALDAVRGLYSLGELSARYKVHPTQIAQLKKQLLELAPEVFERGRSGAAADAETLTAPLYQEIGRLKMEVDFLRKKLWAHPRRSVGHGSSLWILPCQYRGSARCWRCPVPARITCRTPPSRTRTWR